MLEICANSVESAIAARKGGANRIELCENLENGGTTPSYGTLKICRGIPGLKIHVLIRPRGGDFCYSETEFNVMEQDVIHARKVGADGIVSGILLKDDNIDLLRTKRLVELASPMSFTFHRAFDVCPDPFRALEEIVSLGISRILTSGQKPTAVEGAPLLAQLIGKAGKRVIIMPGSGINVQNIAWLKRTTGALEFHTSASQPAGGDSGRGGLFGKNPRSTCHKTVVKIIKVLNSEAS